MDIGVRELRNGLSRYLTVVRQGQTVTITDRGRPVARIVPVGRLSALERLIAEGRITPGGRSQETRPLPVDGGGPVSDLVTDQRR